MCIPNKHPAEGKEELHLFQKVERFKIMEVIFNNVVVAGEKKVNGTIGIA